MLAQLSSLLAKLAAKLNPDEAETKTGKIKTVLTGAPEKAGFRSDAKRKRCISTLCDEATPILRSAVNRQPTAKR